MKFVRCLSLLTLLGCLMLDVSVAQDDSAVQDKQGDVLQIDIEGTKVKIPSPGDFVGSKSKLETMAKFMKQAAPMNTLHEIFADKDVTEKIHLEKGLERNADIQTVDGLANKVDKLTFDQIKSVLGKQFDQIMKDAGEALKKSTGVGIELQDKGGSGVFLDEDAKFGYLLFTAVTEPDGSKVDRVSAACVVHLDNNMILLNVHSNLKSDKDADWVKEQATKWMEQVLKANDEQN